MVEDDEELYFDKEKDYLSLKFHDMSMEELRERGIVYFDEKNWQRMLNRQVYGYNTRSITMREAREMGIIPHKRHESSSH